MWFTALAGQSAPQSYHYYDAIMSTMASQITSLTIVYWSVYSGTDQRKHQSSASLAFVLGIHRGPVNSQHKWPGTRKMFPFDDVIMSMSIRLWCMAYGNFQTVLMPANLAHFPCDIFHDDVIKWKHFPRCWLFVRGTTGHRWIPRTRPVTRNFNVFFDLRLNKRLIKQSRCR